MKILPFDDEFKGTVYGSKLFFTGKNTSLSESSHIRDSLYTKSILVLIFRRPPSVADFPVVEINLKKTVSRDSC